MKQYINRKIGKLLFTQPTIMIMIGHIGAENVWMSQCNAFEKIVINFLRGKTNSNNDGNNIIFIKIFRAFSFGFHFVKDCEGKFYCKTTVKAVTYFWHC